MPSPNQSVLQDTFVTVSVKHQFCFRWNEVKHKGEDVFAKSRSQLFIAPWRKKKKKGLWDCFIYMVKAVGAAGAFAVWSCKEQSVVFTASGKCASRGFKKQMTHTFSDFLTNWGLLHSLLYLMSSYLWKLKQACAYDSSKVALACNMWTLLYMSVTTLSCFIKVFCINLGSEECGIMINCPCLHLALNPEPPGGAPQGYSRVFSHWTLANATACYWCFQLWFQSLLKEWQ